MERSAELTSSHEVLPDGDTDKEASPTVVAGQKAPKADSDSGDDDDDDDDDDYDTYLDQLEAKADD